MMIKNQILFYILFALLLTANSYAKSGLIYTVHSYHPTHTFVIDCTAGIEKVLNKDYEFVHFYMDTK